MILSKILGADAIKEANVISAVTAAKNLEAEATKRLNEEEMKNALINRGYSSETAAKAAAIYTKAGAKQAEAVATKNLTVAEAIEALMQENLTAQEAKEMLLRSGVITQKELEENATIRLTSAKLAEAGSDGAVIAGATGVTISNTAEAVSFNFLTDSIIKATKAMWKFIKSPLGLITIAVAAGIALKKLSDKLNLTYEGALKNTEKSLEKFDEINSEVERLESNVDSLKTSLTSLADKYDIELNGSETVSEIIDKINGADLSSEDNEVFNNIVKQNEQYERQIALKEKLLEFEQRKAAKNASDTLNNTQKSVADKLEGEVPGGKRKHIDQIGNVTVTDAVKENIDAIQEYEQKIAELEEKQLSLDVDSKEWKKAEEDVKEYEEAIEALYEDTDEKTDELNTLLRSFSVDGEGLKPLKGYEEEFNAVSTALEYLNKLSLNNVIEEVEELGKTVEKNLSYVERMSKVENMATGFDMLGDIYTDVKDGKEFDYTSILNNADFNEAFGNYKEEYDNFIKTITNSPKDIKKCQDAFNDLATAYLYGQDALEHITDETKEATILWLKQKGVVNAEEVAEAALAKTKDKLIAKEEALNIAKKKNIDVTEDVEDATYEEISALYNAANALVAEGEASETTRQYLANLALSKINVNNVKINTQSDIDQIIALANASGAAIGYISALETALKNLQNKQSNANKFRGADGNIAYMNTGWQIETAVNGAKVIEEEIDAAKELEKALAVIKKSSLNSADYHVDVKYDYKDPSSSGSGSGSDTEESFDWIQVKIERLEREIENLDQIVNATYKSWTDRNKSLTDEISKVTEEIAVQEAGYKKYIDLANSIGLEEPYKTLVQNGAIDYTTLKDEKLIERINKYKEFYELALACEDATKDLRDELAALAKTSFDNVVNQYEERFSLIEHEASVLETYINQVETKGHIVSKSYYEELLKVEQKNLGVLREEYSSLQSALEQAMKDGSIQEGSSDWYDMIGQINDVEIAIIESNTALIEFQKNIRDLEWESFDRLEDMISQIADEADFLIDLMSDEDLFDEKGNVTDQGKATFGLHSVKYNTYMEQSKDYANEILEIDKELADDPYNVELLERREELLQSQRDSILAAKDEKQAMIDLAEEGYNKMLDYLDKIIDKRKEALQAEKDLYDYEKNVREQTEEIARLEKIGQALSGDTSEEGQLRAQQNAKELEEAREALEETEYDKYISDQEKMLDTLANEAEQWVNERLNNVDQLLSDIIGATNENAVTIKKTLETETGKVGIKLSEDMSNIWSSDGKATSVVSTYVGGVSTGITSVVTVLERIEGFVSAMTNASDEEASADINGTSNNVSPAKPSTPSSGTTGSASNTSTTSPTIANTNTNNNSNSSISSNKDSKSDWGSWFIGKKYSGSKSKLNIDTSIVDRLKYNDFESSFSSRSSYYKAMGGSGNYTGSASQNKWMISEMKKNGFNSGGLIGSMIRSTGEDGFVLAKAGEYILTADQFKELGKAITIAEPFIKSAMQLPQNLGSYNNNISNDVQMNIQMYGVQDVQGLVNELQRDNRFQKIVQQMTIGKISGSNGLGKYKY